MKLIVIAAGIVLTGLLFAGCSPVVETDTVKNPIISNGILNFRRLRLLLKELSGMMPELNSSAMAAMWLFCLFALRTVSDL